MKRRIFSYPILALLCLSLAAAVPFLYSDNEQSEDWICSSHTHNTKTFQPRSPFTQIGVICSDNAIVALSQCLDESCEKQEYLASGYKANGKLPEFHNFRLDTYYHYDCYTCKDPAENTPPIIRTAKTQIAFMEGKQVTIEASCFDEEADYTELQYKGWMNSSSRSTDFNMSRARPFWIYDVMLECTDEFQATTRQLVEVGVYDKNRAPKFVAIEGEIVRSNETLQIVLQ